MAREKIYKLPTPQELKAMGHSNCFATTLAFVWKEKAPDFVPDTKFFDIPKFLDLVFLHNPFHSLGISSPIFNEIMNHKSVVSFQAKNNIPKMEWKELNVAANKLEVHQRFTEISTRLVDAVLAIVSSNNGEDELLRLMNANKTSAAKAAKISEEAVASVVLTFKNQTEYDDYMKHCCRFLIEEEDVQDEQVAPLPPPPPAYPHLDDDRDGEILLAGVVNEVDGAP
jgi:hypothetical protein